MAPFHTLRLNDLIVPLHLGCTAEERATPQEVRVSLRIRFQKPPAAVTSDRLEETVCYAALAQIVRAQAEGREFHLIEKFAGDLYARVRAQIPVDTYLRVRVHKVRPPITNLQGGTVYECGDDPA